MADVTERVRTRTESIKAKYKPQLDALQVRGQQIRDEVGDPGAVDAAIGVDFDVTMRDQEIIFDVPTATMRTQQVSLDLPEFTMVQNRIVFHLPEAYMKEVVISDNPITGKIIMHVPDVRMVENVVILDLPSVTMKRQELSLDLPEFGTERVRWVIGLPEFTIKNVKAAISKAQAEGHELSNQAKALASTMQAELQQAVSDVMAGKDGGERPGAEVLESYDKAIKTMEDTIAALVSKGVDPIKVPTEGGSKNLRKELELLVEQRAKISSSLVTVAA